MRREIRPASAVNNGNLIIEQIVKPLNISETFIYDAYNRIGKASEGTAPAWSQTYNYDAYGMASDYRALLSVLSG
jgi:hypothetical protein